LDLLVGPTRRTYSSYLDLLPLQLSSSSPSHSLFFAHFFWVIALPPSPSWPRAQLPSVGDHALEKRARDSLANVCRAHGLVARGAGCSHELGPRLRPVYCLAFYHSIEVSGTPRRHSIGLAYIRTVKHLFSNTHAFSILVAE